MIVVPNGDNGCCQVLTACVNGLRQAHAARRTTRVKGRGTRGVINIDANERNGDVVGMKLVVRRRRDHADHPEGHPDPHPRQTRSARPAATPPASG